MRFRGPAAGARSVRAALCLFVTAVGLAPGPARAWIDLGGLPDGRLEGALGVHVLDGSYVMNVGELQINITNHGLIGSQYTEVSTFADAPSGQWPAGSGNEYLWSAGLWVGGVLGGEAHVSTGQYERELRPLEDRRATIYEARDGQVTRPQGGAGTHGVRVPQAGCDDDHDGRTDEETLNGYDDDGDGLVDEDFAQLGRQMMVCTMYDNTALSLEIYPDHVPLDLKVVQTSFCWDAAQFRDFVAFNFEITNIGTTPIQDVYVGLFVDCDIGPRQGGDGGRDDLVGLYEGMVQASDGTYSRISVGYMYDGAAVDPLPGYFGALFLGAGTSRSTQIRSFQRFAGQQPYEFGGDPVNDEGRYALLSSPKRDANANPGQENDYRYLVSVGPWGELAPGDVVRFDAALVIGAGREGLLKTCADALAAWRGAFFDLDHDSGTGVLGRETQLCYDKVPPSGDPIYQRDIFFMDESCVGPFVFRHLITPSDFEIQPDGSACIWVDMDNCEECDRLTGDQCTTGDRYFEQNWICNQWWRQPQELIGCTGVNGAESRVSWIVEKIAPPPPALRVVPGDGEVRVFWNDVSEYAVDPQMLIPDFESYRIWRSDDWERPLGTSLENGPESGSWRLLAEFDLENVCVVERDASGVVLRDTLELGANTGLAGIAYRPACLDDPRFTGLAEAMQAVVDADSLGQYDVLPPLRDPDGLPGAGLESLLPWEAHPAVLDTFFLVTGREGDPGAGVVPKRPVGFYQYLDREVHNGFLYFYSVTATDHRLDWLDGLVPVGEGLVGPPSSSFASTTPGTRAQSVADVARYGANIFVYPNPASRSSLAEFQRLHPNADDPTGERVMFANLPRSRNRISIFTTDGDLVQEIWHDGTTGHGEISWNLVSRNGQQIVSGIYIYAVQPEDRRFERFVGKFVVIR